MYLLVWGSRSGISASIPSRMMLPYSVMPSKCRWFTRGGTMTGDVSENLQHCSISIIYMVSNSTFCSNSLNYGVTSSFVTLVSIFNRDHTDPLVWGA